ncbi:hypothetical protein ACLOJK_037161 [Asimina triloba]
MTRYPTRKTHRMDWSLNDNLLVKHVAGEEVVALIWDLRVTAVMGFLSRKFHVILCKPPRKAHLARQLSRFVSTLPEPRQSSPPHSFLSITMSSSTSSSSAAAEPNNAASATSDRSSFLQNVVVMRHGDRLDNSEPLWESTAPRPWDPPLTEGGKIRAWSTGKKLKNLKEFRIDRVFVSPFVRCIQTAAQVVSALCAVDGHAALLAETSANAVLDPNKVKVSIEYGLCEMLSKEAIRVSRIPKDDKWALDISELEAMLPAGTIDRSAEHIYLKAYKFFIRTKGQLDQGEREWNCRCDLLQLFLADDVIKMDAFMDRLGSVQVIKIGMELWKAGLGLMTSKGRSELVLSGFLKDIIVYDVEYCAYALSQRQISFPPSGGFKAEDFKVLTKNAQTGICFCSKEEDY